MTVIEQWRVHPTIARYEIGSLGHLRINGQSTLLRPHVDRYGYWAIQILIDGVYRRKRVHSLVCETFHGPKPSPAHQSRHLNGDRLDARAANLAWGTRSENTKDSVLHGTHNNARKTHCKRDHEFTPENTRFVRGGRRSCRKCERIRAIAHMRALLDRIEAK